MRPRIRTIKPEAFADEELYDAEAETGLPLRWAFAGLWCYADCEGVFEWRPRALKSKVLPYDDCDFSRVLDALATRGFLVRYAFEGREYGWVRNFARHQVVNNREKKGDCPPPPDPSMIPEKSTRAPRVADACPTRQGFSQAELELERELERELDSPKGDAGGGTPAPLAKRGKRKAKTHDVWEAYSSAYEARYGVEPVRNAKVNGQLSQFVKRVGEDNAPPVASFYLTINKRYYLDRHHPVDALLKDAEALYTQWQRGRATTRGDVAAAEHADEYRAQGERVEALVEAMDSREASSW